MLPVPPRCCVLRALGDRYEVIMDAVKLCTGNVTLIFALVCVYRDNILQMFSPWYAFIGYLFQL